MSTEAIIFSTKIEEELRKPVAEQNQGLLDFWKSRLLVIQQGTVYLIFILLAIQLIQWHYYYTFLFSL